MTLLSILITSIYQPVYSNKTSCLEFSTKNLTKHIQAIVKSALNDADTDTKGNEEFQLWSTLSIQMKTTNKSKLRGKWSQCLYLVKGCVCGTNVCGVHALKKPNNSFHKRTNFDVCVHRTSLSYRLLLTLYY